MGAVFSNNASSLLANSISDSATSISITPGDGVRFPTLAAGDWAMLTLIKLVGGAAQMEIVRATAKATDVFTIVRAQEGTSALSFSAGDKVDLRITAGGINSKLDKSGGSITGPVEMNDKPLTGAALADVGLTFFDSAANNTIDLRKGSRQRWAPPPGPQMLTIEYWPPIPMWGELMLKIESGGGRALTSSVPIKWLKSDGTLVTSTSISTNHGATLQTNGTDRVALWQEEDGSIIGKVLR